MRLKDAFPLFTPNPMGTLVLIYAKSSGEHLSHKTRRHYTRYLSSNMFMKYDLSEQKDKDVNVTQNYVKTQAFVSRSVSKRSFGLKFIPILREKCAEIIDFENVRIYRLQGQWNPSFFFFRIPLRK
jgi:hypothetical protein